MNLKCLLVLTFGVCLYPRLLSASDIEIHSSILTRSVITLSKTSDMEFGLVEYEPAHSGQILLSTDDSVTLSGAATGLSLSGAPQAGQVSIAGDGKSTIEISCETSGILSDGNTNALILQSIEIAVETGTSFGGGTPCSGIGNTSSTIDLGETASPTILIGGAIDVTGNAIASADLYNSTNTGGDPVTLRVVYQ